MEVAADNATGRVGIRSSSRRTGMPYLVRTDFAAPSLGAAFVHSELDSFWRPFYLSPVLTPELAAARPDPFLTVEPSSKKIPDIFGCMSTWIVREPIKDVIEDLEPGVHAFVPLHALTETSHKPLGVFYAMRIQQVVDAIVIEGTDYAEGPGRTGLEKSESKPVLPFSCNGSLLYGQILSVG